MLRSSSIYNFALALFSSLLLPGTSATAAELDSSPVLFRWSGQGPSEAEPKRDQPLASDRPDFTEASSTVGAGLTQVEMGYTYIKDRDRSNNTRTQEHSYPETLFRIGMFADWFEWRIAYNNTSQVTTINGLPSTTVSGAEDLYLGIKLALTEQDGWLPEMALMPQMTVPTGISQFTSNETLPGLNWLYGWDITERISMAGSTQFNKSIDGDGTNYYEYAQSWTIGYTFTEHWSGYTEWFGLLPSGASTALPEYYFNGGFVFPITNNLQFDIRAGVGLNDNASDFFGGSGLVVRF